MCKDIVHLHVVLIRLHTVYNRIGRMKDIKRIHNRQKLINPQERLVFQILNRILPMADEMSQFFQEVDNFINSVEDKDYRPLAYIEQQRIDIEKSVLSQKREIETTINGLIML